MIRHQKLILGYFQMIGHRIVIVIYYYLMIRHRNVIHYYPMIVQRMIWLTV